MNVFPVPRNPWPRWRDHRDEAAQTAAEHDSAGGSRASSQEDARKVWRLRQASGSARLRRCHSDRPGLYRGHGRLPDRARRKYDHRSVTPRRFPSSGSVEETDACFIVRDVNGRTLACVYFRRSRGGAQSSTPRTWHLPMQLRAEDCVTGTNRLVRFYPKYRRVQCPTRSKLRRRESAASMQYRC